MKIVERNGKFWLLTPLRTEGLKPDDDLIAYREWELEDLRDSEPLGPFQSREEAERAISLRINKIKPAP